MAKIDNENISDRDWGDVDKSALGKRLAGMYADGDATKANMREVYAYVPDEAFTESDGKKNFAYSKAWGPHHEVQENGTIILNRNGVHSAAAALAGARAKPKLSDDALADAKKHIRRHYRSHLKEKVPDSLKERRKVERGKPLTELVKGSLEYTRHVIVIAFYQTFRYHYDDNDWFWVEEIFADFLIVSHSDLPPDEFYYVLYSQDGETFTFAPREEWEIVELAYQFKSTSIEDSKKDKRNRLIERVNTSLDFTEAEKKNPNPDGPWRIRAVGITADVVNANGRRYATHVLEAAVRDLQDHLNESAGQGRLILTGEIDHPTDKGNSRALLQETVINWDSVQFNSSKVLLEGWLMATSRGRDLRALMRGGVRPDISQRGYGQSTIIEEGSEQIEEVLELYITGYDPVLDGADPNGQITVIESKQPKQPKQEDTPKMDKLTLEALREEYPDLVAKIEAERDKTRRQELEAQLEARKQEDERLERELKEREQALRQRLDIKDDEDLVAALTERQTRLQELEQSDSEDKKELQELREAKRKQEIEAYVAEQVKDLKYDEDIVKLLTESIQAANPQTTEEVDKIIESRRKEYDAMMAKITLAQKGKRGNGVQVIGPVFETETGQPEFVRPAFEFTERMVERNVARRRDFSESPQLTPNERFTRRYLEAFDRAYRSQLIEEHKRLEAFLEAETTSDLNLPYSVSRAIIEEAFPELVALSVYDFALEDGSPTYIYFESYSDESGKSVAVTDEAFTSDSDAWVSLTYKRLEGGTVSITSSPAGTTYAEYDDYVIDYGNGKIMVLSTGSMSDATAYLANYTYNSVRGGEGSAIQRGKGTLSRQAIELAADRLATIITDEAITFSRTQLGWDAVTRTISMVIRELRQMIDSHMIRLALASSVRAANNGGTWTYGTTEAALDDLVIKLGGAKVAVMNDHYMPTHFLASLSNAEILSNWKGFTRDGFPDAVLRSTGFVGGVKGLPMFQSAQMVDTHFLTGHPELVQHRVLSSKPMTLKGPFQGMSSNNLIAAQEYYAEEYNATESLVVNKGGFVTVET